MPPLSDSPPPERSPAPALVRIAPPTMDRSRCHAQAHNCPRAAGYQSESCGCSQTMPSPSLSVYQAYSGSRPWRRDCSRPRWLGSSSRSGGRCLHRVCRRGPSKGRAVDGVTAHLRRRWRISTRKTPASRWPRRTGGSAPGPTPSPPAELGGLPPRERGSTVNALSGDPGPLQAPRPASTSPRFTFHRARDRRQSGF
jgi:hypothetical protein